MKTILQTLTQRIALYAGICMMFSCDLNDEVPNNELGKYDLPPEVASEIFTPEVLAVTGSLEPFLDLIQQNGMQIHEGESPPEIYWYNDNKNQVALIFTIGHSCLYDSNFTSYKDSIFGRYEDHILIAKDQEGNYVSDLRYFSLMDPLYPQYPDRLDTGFGAGTASGSGSDFTMFVNVKDGIFGGARYEALWIISGSYQANSDYP
ncbi:MAG TPA: hypothetical protein VLA71_06835, partial [Algoriphagus sp.]|nr:hypothetical protein [Algoriphagus sp.]